MTKFDDGGPAFPRSASGYTVSQDGMTLWDYFAAHAPDDIKEAIPGTATNCSRELGIADTEYRYQEHYPILLAIASCRYADAMIAERRKRRG